VVFGCNLNGGGGDGDADPQTTSLNEGVAGVWRLSDGDSVHGFDTEDLKYLQFNSDGTGMLVYEHEFGLLANPEFLYAVINEDTISIDFPWNTMVMFSANLYMYTRSDSGALEVSDAHGNTLRFTSESAIPDSMIMEEVEGFTDYPDLEIEPDSPSGLVYDGTLLWFEEDYTRTVYPFDPVRGTLDSDPSAGRELSFAGQYTHIKSYQGASFWTTCHCGANEEAARVNEMNGSEIDRIDTDGDLGDPMSVSALAWDGTHLWVEGRRDADNKNSLYKVDANAEPDLLIAIYESINLNALAFDGTDFWGLSFYHGSKLVRFELTASRISVLASYEIPDSTINWNGLEVVGNDIFLLGDDYTSPKPGIIRKVSL
jgi:hypothetical protein